jgi:signal transduction histidine kinase
VADRVTALDGELTISSAPASGTILHAEIPLPATPA